MAFDKLRAPPQAPPLFEGTPSSIIENAKRLIGKLRRVQTQVVEDVQPEEANFTTVLLPLAHAKNAMAREAYILGFYKDVSTDPELRQASSDAKKLFDDFAIRTAMREDLYVLIDAVFKKNENLDPESRRLLEKEHKNYIRNGLSIPAGTKRDCFEDIKMRLNELTRAFRKNLIDENGGVWFLLDELEGVPEDIISGLEQGKDRDEGKLRITFNTSDFSPTMRYANNDATRKRLYIAYQNKCNQNVPLFKETMMLRNEAATILGYPDHAAFRIEDKMAKKPENVNAFLNDLLSKITPYGHDESKKLKQLKKSDLESRDKNFDGKLYIWDYAFYTRMMLQKQYFVDQQRIAEYFPLQTTISGMLDIFQQLFGLVFVEIEGDEKTRAIVWQEDVQLFSVWDDAKEGGSFNGYLYLDLFPRPGKYGHMANFNLQPGFIQEDGTRHYPATALVCNFTKPTTKKPSLLRHDEMWQLFHELGHGIHDLVSRTTYSRFHGTATVDDFCEAPSQMLENWCWIPSQLKYLSQHYSSLSREYLQTWEKQAGATSAPPEKLPDEMIDNLIRSKNVNGALFQLRQLHLCIFDMKVHQPTSQKAIEDMNISVEFNSLQKQIVGLDAPDDNEWGHGEANFGHLLGSYDAGYYGYLYSKVYSADMFHTAFKADPMSSRQGRRYRHTVLERGGSQDEMETLIEFLGREPNINAFYQELGLV